MPRPLTSRYFVSLGIADDDHLLFANFPITDECSKLVERSLDPQGLRDGLLPAELFHYSVKFERGLDGGSCMRFIVQNDISAHESIIQSVFRKAASVGSDRIGIAICKGVGGIARRIDELSRLLKLVSCHAPIR